MESAVDTRTILLRRGERRLPERENHELLCSKTEARMDVKEGNATVLYSWRGTSGTQPPNQKETTRRSSDEAEDDRENQHGRRPHEGPWNTTIRVNGQSGSQGGTEGRKQRNNDKRQKRSQKSTIVASLHVVILLSRWSNGADRPCFIGWEVSRVFWRYHPRFWKFTGPKKRRPRQVF